MVDAFLDRAFMRRALFWAERGRGRTSPNPAVGAVVVDPGGVVRGQGTTEAPGGRHAEIVALDEAGPYARGATLYCTLEPCSHTGRTGPCADRIVREGVARVVTAVPDANPRVAGRGLAFLRAHGVAVTVGVEAPAAEIQLQPFFTWVTAGRPFVTLKAALSRDGFVGLRDRRVPLTSAVANRYFQRQRAEVDAIAVGAETVRVDDPQLTARGAFRVRPLTRVVFDRRGRVAASARLFSTLEAGPVIMVMARDVLVRRPEHVERLAALGAEIEPCEAAELGSVLAALACRGIVSLLVEGGPALHQAFADAGAADRIQRIDTPLLLGHGVPAAPVFSALPPGRPVRLGPDTLLDIHVHRTH